MKRLIAALIAGLILIPGCGSSDDLVDSNAKKDKPEWSTPPGKDRPIPMPTEDQAQILVAKLAAFAPFVGIDEDPEATISNARNLCSSILEGDKNLVQSAKSLFYTQGMLTTDEARQIVSIIRYEEWCR
jgi:hypothetical protein